MTASKIVAAAASSAGGDTTDVDEVFSVDTFIGNGTAQVIKNNIALGNSNAGSSVQFAGGSGTEKQSLSYANNANYVVGNNNNFTIEFFVLLNATNDNLAFGLLNDYNAYLTGIYISSATLSGYFQTGSSSQTQVSTGQTLAKGQFYHIALVRNGTTFTIYLNGTSVGTATSSSNIQNAGQFFSVGNYTNNNEDTINGYVSNLRYSSTARYTSNFTPTTVNFTNDSDTILLSCQGQTADLSSNSITVTEGGSSPTLHDNFGPFTGTSGEGGMVWVKTRSHTAGGGIVDSETGASKYLLTNSTAAQVSGNSSVTAFNTTGFTVGSSGTFNENNYEYASWTFRKAEKFFDIVTYTGNSVQGRQIAHNLGSVPGMIWIKILSGGTDHWTVYHRGVTDSDPHDYRLRLNNNTAKHDVIVFNDTAPTSTHFTVSGYSEVNSSGKTYVAYIFAHNNNDGEFGPDGDQDIIKCGQFETTNSSNRQDVDLGFEPQFVLLKNVTNTTSGNWYTMDEIRGMTGGDGNDTSYLIANGSDIEYDFGADTFYKYGSGFGVVDNAFATNVRFIYMAIRRGPLSPPDSASDVFEAEAYTGNGTAYRKLTTNFQVDANLTSGRPSGRSSCLASRLRNGMFETHTSDNTYGVLDNWIDWDYNDGIEYPGVFSYSNNTNDGYVSYNWKRAPKFFDVTVHRSNGQPNQQIPHNLGVVPEMAWIKAINSSNDWFVHHKNLSGGSNLILNSSAAETQSNTSSAATFTSTYWTPGNNGVLSGGGNNVYYMAWLWATLTGISKVGSYTGNGSSQNIDCGFSNGAKFIIIKKFNGGGGWAFFDSSRGIVSGNDPVLVLNNTNVEFTSGDDIDPLSSGFTVNHDTNSFALNGSSNTFIFYAVAA